MAKYEVKPFKIDLSADVARLKTQLAATRLPKQDLVPGADTDLTGIPLKQLDDLQKAWLVQDWKAVEEDLNSYHHFTTVIDGTTIHFIHEKSGARDAIPIIVTHGWPGSFVEYLPVIRPLLKPTEVNLPPGQKKTVSFDVIVPSVPGFAFSSVPKTPAERVTTHTAKLWNTLMVDVLGHKRGYAVAGSDWGGSISWHTYDQFPNDVKLAYVTAFTTFGPRMEQVKADGQTLSEFETHGVNRFEAWSATGHAYFITHATKPNTIGLALHDNAVGQLAWIGEKFLGWSDPSSDLKDVILTNASIYFLTQSFLPSVYEYAHNAAAALPELRKARNSAPLGYGAYKWDTGQYPRYFAEKFGNLVFYREHEKGGHFPGVENPTEWVKDIRDFAAEHFKFN
ncbi:alpha/beta-hydrolase [Auricularia subglabra TFB-10046 SS5]|nr:alpha/beta-hydrolase [Auricularia subglabra TFB-10046 SS5]